MNECTLILVVGKHGNLRPSKKDSHCGSSAKHVQSSSDDAHKKAIGVWTSGRLMQDRRHKLPFREKTVFFFNRECP